MKTRHISFEFETVDADDRPVAVEAQATIICSEWGYGAYVESTSIIGVVDLEADKPRYDLYNELEKKVLEEAYNHMDE